MSRILPPASEPDHQPDLMERETDPLLRRLLRRASHRLVLIDGRSGSGKTTLARRIADELGAQLLHLDHLYPGWEGLAEGARAVEQALDHAAYRRYDWAAGGFAEQVSIDPARPLVVEGCGAVSADNLAAARRFAGAATRDSVGVWSIWLECPEALRRARALGRDGDVFAPHWDRWAAQERALFADTRPIALVDEIAHFDEQTAVGRGIHRD